MSISSVPCAGSLPSVVVIIPFYNGSGFIERSIQSVFAQTIPVQEIIVVNDGSRPEERLVLDELALRYPFRIVDQDNRGQGAARNAGVAQSSAEFICFLDQDDFFLETHCETLVRALPCDDPRFGFVYADVYEANGAGDIVQHHLVKEHASDHPKRSVFEMIAGDMFVLPSASLIARRAFVAVAGFDEQFMGFEDDDLFLRIFRAGFTNYFVDKAVTVWCIHTASTSFGIRMSRSRFKYFKKLVAMFPDEPLRRRYCLRDYLVPRFGVLFINDVIKACVNGNAEHRAETQAMLEDYAAIIVANPHVRSPAKMQFRFATLILRYTPDKVLRWVFSIIDDRVLNRVRRFLQ